MRKILFFAALFCGVLGAYDSYAGKCIVSTCPTSTGKIGPNQEYIYAVIGGNQCYSCDSDDLDSNDEECDYGAIVGVKDYRGRIVSLYKCTDTSGWTDQWRVFTPGTMCRNSEVEKRNVANGETFYLDENTATASGSAGGDHITKLAGSQACWYTICKPNYMPNADKTACVKDNRASDCAASGGTWSNNACTCSTGKNLKQTADKKKCECNKSNYVFDSASKSCKESDASRQQRQQRQQQQATNNAKAKCTTSGGAWTGGKCVCDQNKNLRLVSGACECTSADYTRNGDRCDLTDAAAVKQRCEAVGADVAYWSGTQCVCRDSALVWQYDRCIPNPSIEACKKVTGATWKAATGECVCQDASKVINDEYTACVETDEARQQREAAEEEARLAAARAQIDATVKKIDTLFATMSEDASVWKNADGEFNTARLASDSIAAVVLGTAGGIISSNVIKKNQIENGFEDIQCTVGGQSVAGWGDQFRVGIQ